MDFSHRAAEISISSLFDPSALSSPADGASHPAAIRLHAHMRTIHSPSAAGPAALHGCIHKPRHAPEGSSRHPTADAGRGVCAWAERLAWQWASLHSAR